MHMRVFIFAVLFSFVGSPIWADAIVSNRSDFSQVATNVTIIDFFDVPDNPNHYVDEVSPFAFEGVVFTTDRPLRIFTSGREERVYPYYQVPSLENVNAWNYLVPQQLTISIPNSTATAFGLEFGAGPTGDLPPSGTFTFSNGISLTRVLSSSPGFSFVGVTSTDPITSVTITARSEYSVFVTGITLGTAVPEPSVYGLVIFGVLLLLAVRRLRRRSGLC